MLIICSCTHTKTDHFEWLIGTWKNETSRGIVFESWNKKRDFEYVGMSYSVSEKDTTLFETIRITKDGDNMFYVPTISTQNNALPISFLAKIITPEKLVFENPSHDFPQVITYYRISTDSIVAEISGIIDGKERKRTFPMKRVK